MPTRVKALRSAGEWLLLVRVPREQREGVMRWLEALAPTSITLASGETGGTARAVVRGLPSEWTQLMQGFRVIDLEIEPDGAARVRVSAPPDRLQAFSRSSGFVMETTGAAPHLSPRQLEILQLAADNGYYDVPRRKTLRQISQQLGRSPATVSEGIRKAERQIILDFLRQHDPSRPL